MHPKHIAPYCCHICSETILREGSWLCDYPMKKGNTCDAVLCNAHAYRIASGINMRDQDGEFVDDVHLCPSHYQEWLHQGEHKFWENSSTLF